MKAVIHPRYGSPEVLRIDNIGKPTPKNDELLIKVHATSVSRTDCALLKGTPWVLRLITGLTKPKRFVIGTDFAGEVVDVGNQVTRFHPGDRVWGFNDAGLSSHAEFLVASEKENVLAMPDNCSFVDAAASAEGPHYARNFINKVDSKAEQKVMINGASGAIGSALLQLCKYYGLHVTAVGSTKSLDLLISLGADQVIDYMTTDFTADHQQYDYVFDAVGKSSFEKCRHLLLPRGVYISSELGPRNENPFLAILTAFRSGQKVKFPFPGDVKKSLQLTSQLIAEGKYKPVVDRRFQIEHAREAFEYACSGQKIGAVILSPGPMDR